MNVINIFKNNFKRILGKKEIIIYAAVIIPLFIAIAVLFSVKMEVKATIALVTDSAQNLPQNDKIQVDIMKERPATSNLLLGKYEAIVEKKEDGSYNVITIKSTSDKEKIESFFNSGKIPESNVRGVGTNILGFILTIVLMQGVALTILYPEDRVKKTFRRVLTAPVGEKQYLFAQGIFTFLCLYIPTYLAIAVTKICFGITIGYSLGMLALLVAIVSALSTSFALFITSVLERNISLVASVIYIIACVLAGCFYSFTDNNKVLDAICNIFPQKVYMTLIQGIENRKNILEFRGQMIYLLVWIVGLWLLGSIITNKKMKKGAF